MGTSFRRPLPDCVCFFLVCRRRFHVFLESRCLICTLNIRNHNTVVRASPLCSSTDYTCVRKKSNLNSFDWPLESSAGQPFVVDRPRRKREEKICSKTQFLSHFDNFRSESQTYYSGLLVPPSHADLTPPSPNLNLGRKYVPSSAAGGR